MWGHLTLDPTFFGIPASKLPWHWILAQLLTMAAFAAIVFVTYVRRGKQAARRTAMVVGGPILFSELLRSLLMLTNS